MIYWNTRIIRLKTINNCNWLLCIFYPNWWLWWRPPTRTRNFPASSARNSCWRSRLPICRATRWPRCTGEQHPRISCLLLKNIMTNYNLLYFCNNLFTVSCSLFVRNCLQVGRYNTIKVNRLQSNLHTLFINTILSYIFSKVGWTTSFKKMCKSIDKTIES